MAIHKKIDKGSVATLQKILISGKKIVEDNKPFNWSNIQKVHKQIDIKPIQTNNIMISTSEIKNTRGNMFKRNLEINAIKNTQGNIFKREMMTIDVRIYRPAGDRKTNVIKINGEDMILMKYLPITVNARHFKAFQFGNFYEGDNKQRLIDALLLHGSQSHDLDIIGKLGVYPSNVISISNGVAFPEQGKTRGQKLMNTTVLDTTNQQKINYRYIKYESSENTKELKRLFKVKLNKYVKKNYIKDACLFTNIIETYKNAFNKANERKSFKFELTYKNLFELVFPDRKFEDGYYGATIKDMTPFFRKFKLRCIALDIEYKVIYSYHPQEDNMNVNTNIHPQCFYTLIHNKHSYTLNNNIKSLEHVIGEGFENPNPNDKVVSSIYHIRSEKNESHVEFFCHNIDEIAGIKFSKYSESFIMIQYAGDIIDLLRYFIVELKYEPQVGIYAHSIYKFSFMIDDNIVSIHKVGFNGEDADDHFTEKEYTLYSELQNKLYASVINNATKSTYNENFINILKNNYTYPLTGKLTEMRVEECMDALEVDFNKAYTSNLIDIETFPVFNTFDNFFKYDNHKIQDYTLYYIERNSENDYDAEFILFPKKFSVVYGYVLNRFKANVNILGFCMPSNLVKNRSSEHIKKIYESDLPTSMKKDIVNKTIGCFGKLKNNREKTLVFSDYNEASIFEKKWNTTACKLKLTDNAFIYLVNTRQSACLIDGYFPLSVLIYDIMRLKMATLFIELESKGAEFYGIHTDCFIINERVHGGDVVKSAGGFHYKPASYIKLDYVAKKYGKDFTFDDIGSISKERADNIPEKKLTFEKNKSDVKFIEGDNSNTLKINDEWDEAEINNILINNNKTIIKATVPGAGKTTTLINFCKANPDLKALFVAPYNNLCVKFMDEGFEAITLNQLLGLRFNGKEETKGTKKNIEEYDIIIFEEVYCHTTRNLSRIASYVKENEGIKFYATGDPSQLPPIEDLKVSDFKKYYNYIMSVIFPNEIFLNESKRLKSDDDKKLLLKLKEEILNSTKPIVMIAKENFKVIDKIEDIGDGFKIAYFNDTVHALNVYSHEQVKHPEKFVEINGIKYYAGLDLVCRKYIKLPKGQKMVVNYTYKIKEIDEHVMTLIDFHKVENILSIKELSSFTLNYARTCHSVQGFTIDKEITIFNLSCSFVNKNREFKKHSSVF